MSPHLHSIRTYRGAAHPTAIGKRVVIVSVWRRNVATPEADLDGEFQAGDRVEFAEILRERDGALRVAWVTLLSDAADLGPITGWFDGRIPDGVVVPPSVPAG